MKTLIHGGWVVPLDQKERIYNPGYILVENEIINQVSEGLPAPELIKTVDQIVDASHKLVMPGLVNAHTHLFQTFLRGLGEDKPLQEWLEAYIWPLSSKMGSREAELSATIGILENIRGGVTAVIDNQYIHNTPDTDDIYCSTAENIGIRYLLARGWADRNYHPAFLETGEQIIQRVGELVKNWNHSVSGRIRIEFGPLSKPRCTTATFQKTWEAAREWGIGVQMHTSETQEQTDFCIREENLRTVEWLERIGCLDEHMQLVHSIWLDEHEMDLVADRRAKVVHCPISNMILASGVAPISLMVKKGITIALATDGPGSNNNQDMVESMKTASLLHKVTQQNARIFQPADLLWMACRGGAEAFGQPELIGSLEPGKRADIVVVNLESPFAEPVHHPVSALVYCLHGSDVDTVMVNGRILLKNKEFVQIDLQRVIHQCREAAADLVSRL